MTDSKRGLLVKHLEQWRRYRVMTQAELAEKAGITRGTIIRAEAGGYMNYAKVRAVAAALDITPQQLLAGPPEGFTEVAGAA